MDCYYCGDFATTIDHIMPRSFKRNNAPSNLVPACLPCNVLARNNLFPSLEEKKSWILNHRSTKRRLKKRAIYEKVKEYRPDNVCRKCECFSWCTKHSFCWLIKEDLVKEGC